MSANKQRRFALVICIALLFAILSSTLFILKEADHDCIGEGCSICACIHQVEQTLKRLGNGFYEATEYVPVVLWLVAAVSFAPLAALCASPITQKVRLNN